MLCNFFYKDHYNLGFTVYWIIESHLHHRLRFTQNLYIYY